MGNHFICVWGGGGVGVVVLCNTKEINIHFLFAFALVITTNTRRIINSTSTTNIIDTSIRTVHKHKREEDSKYIVIMVSKSSLYKQCIYQRYCTLINLLMCPEILVKIFLSSYKHPANVKKCYEI